MGYILSSGTEALFFVLGMLFLFIGVISINIYFSVKAANKIRNLQQELLTAEIISIEKERKRLARDLHDSIGPTITTMKLYNSMVKPLDEESKDHLDKQKKHLDEMAIELRRISHNILPPFNEHTNISELVRYAVTNFKPVFQNTGVDLTLEIEEKGFILQDYEQLHLYRVIQEAFTNIIKHSEATRVHINLSFGNPSLQLSISDNGKGFDQTGKMSGLGMINMKNRVSLLKGTIQVESSEKGTVLLMQIPLPL